MDKLNELEVIQKEVKSLDPIERREQLKRNKYLFANRFTYNTIHMIDLDKGIAVKEWDLSELNSTQAEYVGSTGEKGYDFNNNVLNGIAYREETDTFLVTGKMWDFLFEVKLDYHDYIR